MDEDIEVTELHDLDVTRQDGVENPASGFTFLIRKAAKAKVKDFSGMSDAEQASWEAAEGDVTDPHNKGDGKVDVPAGAETTMPRMDCCNACGSVSCNVGKAHREFHQDERKRLAAKGHALPDGSYPIPDADALERAAILARSGHGDVAAAKRLIAKRAKELGVPNPLRAKAQKDIAEMDELEKAAEEAVTETTEAEPAEKAAEAEVAPALTEEKVQELIKAALEADRSAAEKTIESLKSELEVLKATPIPGGPSLMPSADEQVAVAKSKKVAEAAWHRREADKNGLAPELKQYHLNLAKSLEAEVK